jgi:hypothetical protein
LNDLVSDSRRDIGLVGEVPAANGAKLSALESFPQGLAVYRSRDLPGQHICHKVGGCFGDVVGRFFLDKVRSLYGDRLLV